MTPREKTTIRAIIRALHVKRDRLGRLAGTPQDKADLQALKMSFGLPHGGLDEIDAAVMVMQAMVGDDVVSAMDAFR